MKPPYSLLSVCRNILAVMTLLNADGILFISNLYHPLVSSVDSNMKPLYSLLRVCRNILADMALLSADGILDVLQFFPLEKLFQIYGWFCLFGFFFDYTNITDMIATHPDSSNWLCKSHITQYHVVDFWLHKYDWYDSYTARFLRLAI